MNNSQLKKLIQKIALQEIRVVTPNAAINRRFVVNQDEDSDIDVYYESPQGINLEGYFSNTNQYVPAFPPNSIKIGTTIDKEGPEYNAYLEMVNYLQKNNIPYNLNPNMGNVWIAISLDNLKKRNLVRYIQMDSDL